MNVLSYLQEIANKFQKDLRNYIHHARGKFALCFKRLFYLKGKANEDTHVLLMSEMGNKTYM